MCYWWEDDWWLEWLWYVFLKCELANIFDQSSLNVNCARWSDVVYLLKYVFDDDYENNLMMILMMLNSDDEHVYV